VRLLIYLFFTEMYFRNITGS